MGFKAEAENEPDYYSYKGPTEQSDKIKNIYEKYKKLIPAVANAQALKLI